MGTLFSFALSGLSGLPHFACPSFLTFCMVDITLKFHPKIDRGSPFKFWCPPGPCGFLRPFGLWGGPGPLRARASGVPLSGFPFSFAAPAAFPGHLSALRNPPRRLPFVVPCGFPGGNCSIGPRVPEVRIRTSAPRSPSATAILRRPPIPRAPGSDSPPPSPCADRNL